MSHLFDLITQGKVGAVACQDEDRLFRDVTQIQVNIFVEACRSASVLVLTPGMVYDFSNEITGTFHARQFRFKSEMAAEYINTVVKGRLMKARHRIRMEGRWCGGNVAVGYMIDTRKTLVEGTPNPEWRKFKPFEPYAEVIRAYFDLFLKNAGNFTATLRHIHQHGPYYPDPVGTPPPKGFKTGYQMKKYEKGYCPGRCALQNILTNAAYIGHWAVRDVIVRWNNHAPIVSEETFFKAYNYLMPTDLQGNDNQNYTPFHQQSRPSLEEDRPVERPLLAGMAITFDGDQQRTVGTYWVAARQHYQYTAWDSDPIASKLWGRHAEHIDSAVSELVKEKLKATFNDETWQEVISTFSEAHLTEQRRRKTQLIHLETVMQNQITSLETLTTPELIREVEKRYADAKSEHERISEAIESSNTEAIHLEAITKLRDNYQEAIATWSAMTQDEKRNVFHAFIKRAILQPDERSGTHISIEWNDHTESTISLARKSPVGNSWSPDDRDTLIALVESNADQITICAYFPDRTWERIQRKIYLELGAGAYDCNPFPINANLTYEMYIAKLQGIEYVNFEVRQNRWKEQELENLDRLLDENEDQLSIAENFPKRKWTNIRRKIIELRGADFQTKKMIRVQKNETFEDFKARIVGVSYLSEAQYSSIVDHSRMDSPILGMLMQRSNQRLRPLILFQSLLVIP